MGVIILKESIARSLTCFKFSFTLADGFRKMSNISTVGTKTSGQSMHVLLYLKINTSNGVVNVPP